VNVVVTRSTDVFARSIAPGRSSAASMPTPLFGHSTSGTGTWVSLSEDSDVGSTRSDSSRTVPATFARTGASPVPYSGSAPGRGNASWSCTAPVWAEASSSSSAQSWTGQLLRRSLVPPSRMIDSPSVAVALVIGTSSTAGSPPRGS
jgi:hypothetical protein